MPGKVLSVAAATGRIGYVFVLDGRLCDWRISETAAQSPADAADRLRMWIKRRQPEVVITERLTRQNRKGAKTKLLIQALADTAAEHRVLDITVIRQQHFANKYEEAVALGETFPFLKQWVPPPRKFYENEPRSTVLFEAAAMAKSVLAAPSTTIARRLG